MLYNSYSEKINSLSPRFLGIVYDRTNDAGTYVKACNILTNCGNDFEYKIVIETSDGTEYVLRGYNSDSHFCIDDDLCGECKVYMKSKTNNVVVSTLELSIP